MPEESEGGRQNVDVTLLDQRIGQVFERKLRQLGYGGGIGPSGGGMDPWQQSVENRLADVSAQLRELREDIRGLRSELGSQFRWLLGTFISTFIIFFGIVMGAMARGFGWL